MDEDHDLLRSEDRWNGTVWFADRYHLTHPSAEYEARFKKVPISRYRPLDALHPTTRGPPSILRIF